MGLDSIAMAKKTPKMHYQYNGEMLPVTEIYKQNRKRRGLSKYLLSVDVNVVKGAASIPAKVVFVRNRNNKKDYLAIISTDITLDENENHQNIWQEMGHRSLFQGMQDISETDEGMPIFVL